MRLKDTVPNCPTCKSELVYSSDCVWFCALCGVYYDVKFGDEIICKKIGEFI